MTKSNAAAQYRADMLGTVSHGTMQPRHLIPAFEDALESLTGVERSRVLPDHPDAEYERLEYLFEALNDLAPEGCYFGAHPGDGSDFGFWEHEEI